MAIRPRLITWAEPKHEPIIRSLIADNACELIGVCAARADDAATLAHAHDVEKLADLRQAMLSPDAEVIWLATHAPIDTAMIKAIHDRGLLVLSSEPNVELLTGHLASPHEADAVSFVPAFTDSKGFSAARDSLEQFGSCKALNLVFTSTPEQGSLFARLFDAMLMTRALLGEVELIDAAMTMPRSSVPEQLIGLHGTMTLNMRIAGQRAASALISSTAAAWSREVIVMGENAHAMRITESHCQWLHDDGGAGPARQADETASESDPGSLIADRLMRMMQLPEASRVPAHGTKLLAMCEAARLSARVGFAEAPGTISQMLGRT